MAEDLARAAKKAKTNKDQLMHYVVENANYFVKKLGEIVAIDGVSAEPQRRPKLRQTAEWLKAHLETLGGNVKFAELGQQQIGGGVSIPLPPVVMAEFHSHPDKPTLCVYGHYDVQPASKSDGWDTEPFEMTDKDGKLYGRGTTDDKGPILAWMWAIRAFKDLNMDLPVNIKLMLEGMEESGSIGLEKLVETEASRHGGFLTDVDFICISDNYWIGDKKPCVTYGLRGNVYFFIHVKGCSMDLHSGVHGGAVHEPMTDVIHLLSRLISPSHEITIPGLAEMVEPLTADELERAGDMDFDVERYKNDVGLVGQRQLLHDQRENILMHRWRYPCLSIHGIQHAFAGEGTKTVIPGKVTGKFSIRIVPNMDPQRVGQVVCEYVRREFATLNSPNELVVEVSKAGMWWKSDTSNVNHLAAQQAQKDVYGVEPDLTREGGSIPITLTFQNATGKNVVLLPLGACDDGAHSQNEKINRSNYINGVKVMICYLMNLGTV
eukprot:c8144_g1_i1.p1 GENE.c8144_g1_i1~~c8144_g1_i1.p1  ORF type:complete len:509 (+),score=129.33 c8144_g1_i1:53-1528(+)